MKIGVVTFPGSLDDRDAARAIEIAGGIPVPLFHASDDLKEVQAVASALPRLGFNFAKSVRQGKLFEIEVAEVTDAILADVNVAAEKLLSNPVIENFVVRVEK